MCEKFNVQGTGLYRIGQLFMLNVVFTYIRTSVPVCGNFQQEISGLPRVVFKPQHV